MTRGRRIWAVIGLAWAQLRHDRMRTLLAVLGVTLAVLATTLLAGTGIGVIETGQEKFDTAGRDLWLTGGPVEFAPRRVGGVTGGIQNAHTVAREIGARDTVQTAAPLFFQTIYVGRNTSEFRTLAALGVPSSAGVQITRGRGFENDPHYAGGNYTGPMTHEVLVDPRTASLLNVSVGDTLYIGGTIQTARAHQFTIVGISPTGERFLGTPTVTLPLSELQELTGKTGTDPATLIAITLQEDVSTSRVERELEEAYPQYEIRTNREQLQATIKRQAVVLAGGLSLVILAFVAGFVLTINVLLSLIYQQQREFAALKALGASSRTFAGITLTQGIIIGLGGGGLGIGLTLPSVVGLNIVVRSLTGFANVVRMPPKLLLGGAAMALIMSIIAALLASWQLARIKPLDHL